MDCHVATLLAVTRNMWLLALTKKGRHCAHGRHCERSEAIHAFARHCERSAAIQGPMDCHGLRPRSDEKIGPRSDEENVAPRNDKARAR